MTPIRGTERKALLAIAATAALCLVMSLLERQAQADNVGGKGWKIQKGDGKPALAFPVEDGPVRAPKPKGTGEPVAAKASDGPLFAFQRDGLWGLVDASGAVIYKPQFESEPRFTDGIALARLQGRNFWITDKGKVIAPEKDVARARGFSEGLAPVNIGFEIHMGDILKSAGAWGFVDTTGTIVIEAKFPSVTNFSSGLAAAAEPAERGQRPKWGYIDKKGNWAIKPQFQQARAFMEGLASVGVTVPGQRFVKQGCIDPTGKMVIPAQFEQAQGFQDGYATVRKDGKWGYIDKTGKVVSKIEYDSAGPMRDGMALVWKWEKDARGRIVKSRCGYLNKQGVVVTGLKFESGYDFSDGMGAVQVGGKWGFVDATGKFAIQPEFQSPGTFSDGLAATRIDGKWGYIDKQGKVVIQPKYQFGQPFSNGLARVVIKKVIQGEDVISTKYAYVDKTGKEVFTWEVKPKPQLYEG